MEQELLDDWLRRGMILVDNGERWRQMRAVGTFLCLHRHIIATCSHTGLRSS